MFSGSTFVFLKDLTPASRNDMDFRLVLSVEMFEVMTLVLSIQTARDSLDV